jgi:hypothetical protein
MRHLVFVALLLFVAGVAVTTSLSNAQDGKAGTAPTYSDVAAIFQTRCITCHAGAHPPEGLRLDTYANVMKGVAGGPVVLPGNPAQSEVVKRIKGISKPRMPRNGPPWLTADQISQIEKWIAAGASEK